MLPSVAMKASTQSEAFRLVLTQGLQGPVSDVDAVFCNRDLPSISGGGGNQGTVMFQEFPGQP